MIAQARILAVLIAATAAPFAFAADGTINFRGELVDSTCTVTVNGTVAPAAALVNLPTLSTKLLKAATNVAGQTGFNILLSNCTGPTTTASSFFESGAGVDPLTSNLRNTGTATNVQLQLVDSSNGKVIKTGNFEQVANTTRITKTAAGDTILPYAVQYIATGTVVAGTVLGTVTYSINYQ